MASDEGLQAGGSGAGRDRKRASGSRPTRGGIGRVSAAPKTGPATSLDGAEDLLKQSPDESLAATNGTASMPAQSDELVVVTLKANTGSIVSIEMASADGARHALTGAETARLVGERPTFASLVHDAFEAGIACVLDDGDGGDERGGESEEDADLHDALLDALIEGSAARRLLSRETLHSAVLSTIVQAASSNGTAAPDA